MRQDRNQTVKRFLFMLLACVHLGACVQTMDSDVELNDRPEDDRSYLKAHDRATREKKVTVNFETRFTVSATYLSPEFRSAFAKRFEQLFDAPQPMLEEATTKMGFFVSVFSPDQDGYDLTNEQLWTIQLRTEDRAHKPILIKKLDNKSRWRPFFIAVHQWSQEYLILFDTSSISLDERLVKKANLTLMFANADAKVALVW